MHARRSHPIQWHGNNRGRVDYHRLSNGNSGDVGVMTGRDRVPDDVLVSEALPVAFTEFRLH